MSVRLTTLREYFQSLLEKIRRINSNGFDIFIGEPHFECRRHNALGIGALRDKKQMKTSHKKILNTHWFKAALIAGLTVVSCLAASAQQPPPTLPSIPSGTFNITSYGASTSSANNATAIQDAINAA